MDHHAAHTSLLNAQVNVKYIMQVYKSSSGVLGWHYKSSVATFLFRYLQICLCGQGLGGGAGVPLAQPDHEGAGGAALDAVGGGQHHPHRHQAAATDEAPGVLVCRDWG